MNGWDDRTVAPAACHNNTCMRKALCLHPLFIIAMSVYVLLCAPVSAQMAGVGKDFIGSAIEQGRVAARLITNKGQIPAVSIAVVINDEMVWSEAFGYADLELRAPAAAVTRFRIASISKAFTGTLVAKLVEAGKLDLDTRIRSIDPGLPEHYDAVTVRDLVRHTAGVRHYATGEIAVPDYYETLEDALEVFINDPLLNAPGEAYNYSTYGYTLLGHVIEKATGMSYFDALRENILEPLGLMLHSTTGISSDPIGASSTNGDGSTASSMPNRLTIASSTPGEDCSRMRKTLRDSVLRWRAPDFSRPGHWRICLRQRCCAAVKWSTMAQAGRCVGMVEGVLYTGTVGASQAFGLNCMSIPPRASRLQRSPICQIARLVSTSSRCSPSHLSSSPKGDRSSRHR